MDLLINKKGYIFMTKIYIRFSYFA